MPFLHQRTIFHPWFIDYGTDAGKFRCEAGCNALHASADEVHACIARRTREVHPRVAEWEWTDGFASQVHGGTFRIVADDEVIVCEDGYDTVRVMSDVWESLPHVIVRTPGGFARRTYSPGLVGVEIDEPEAEAEARAWFAARQAEREAQELALREARRKAELDRIEAAPCQGALCRVVKGRKVPKGLVGECFWIGESAYGTRVGLKDEHGTVHWTAASNVERIRDHECPWKHPDCAEDDELRACCARDFMRAIARHAAA